MLKSTSRQNGFTIVELLVVIAVIAILAAVTIVTYNGITSNARVSVMQSDLSNASDKLKIYQSDHGTFPTTLDSSNCPTAPAIDTSSCLEASSGNTFTYTSNGTTFNLVETNSSGISYNVTDSTNIALYNPCPSGFINVPGNSTYSTSDFCVMKYEAKQASATVPISQASGTPWSSIHQANAITYSANVAGCTGCHLITDNEWLTIARNIIGVSSNWSGGSVGSGYIYSGHNDYSPTNTLAASADDNDGYFGTGNSSGSGADQKRTLTLSNGAVIWDFAGNVKELTTGVIAGGQQPGLSGETSYASKQYNNASLLWNGLPAASQPGNVYPGASAWSISQGIGMLYSNYGQTSDRAIVRGGAYGSSITAGILSIDLDIPAPYGMSTGVGFRVAR